MSKIKEIKAREIKDSRGNPTIEVELKTEKSSFIASVPSGASTGKNEALELRDEDGKGVLRAIENVNKIITPKLKGKDPTEQKEIDDLMIQLDGTENKSKLGANAILPVSIAICRAGAAARKVSLYQHIGEISNLEFQVSNLKIPLPMFNILNGGAHAKNDLDIQEFMVVPHKKSIQENLALGSKIFQNLTEILKKDYGHIPEMGDEGGYAPAISRAEQALFLIKNSIKDLPASISLDCAASEFYKDDKYILEGKEFSREQLVDFYKDLTERFPIVSIEDPFSEEDFLAFKKITESLTAIIIVADDLTTTNIKRIKEAKAKKACNGIIIKLNQIGTVTETIEALKLAKLYSWKTIISHRSGETMDTFIADLSVGTGSDFIKSGSPSQKERMVKYGRLLEIESELNSPDQIKSKRF